MPLSTHRRALPATVAVLAGLAVLGLASRTPGADRAELYQTHCASCHGANRLGAMGPALLPENLQRLRKSAAIRVVTEGRAATQMPAFGERLSADQIARLTELIYTPLLPRPEWGADEIRASHVVHHRPATTPEGPVFAADPLNLFVVVELGDHHVSILDGDRLEPIHRFPSRFALHGGAKFSPEGRFVYLGSRDGWVSKFDLYGLRLVAEIRAGINMRNIAVSSDGRYLLAGNYLPHTLVLLDADTLALLAVIPVIGAGGESSRVSAVYDAPPRESFIVALKDIPEVWELGYGLPSDGENAESIAAGSPGAALPRRRLMLEGILDDFFFDPAYRLIVGAARDGGGQVIAIDDGRKLAELAFAGLPHLGSGITWEHEGRTVLATPNLEEAAVSVIDMSSWELVKTIPTQGPGFFMRSHERSAYAWVDVFFGEHRDVVHVIDKRSLEIVATLRPAPGKTAAHVEFTRDGRYALLSVWDDDGAIVAYDASTLQEVKRLPMRKPSGKYNVGNKIGRSAGTSH